MSALVQIGKYKIDRRLGGGGMAEVYLGHLVGAEGFSRPIAIKRVLPGFSDNPTFATMFVEEAKVCARLNHQNIVSVLDFDRDPEHGLFLVMELVDGCDLSALLSSGVLPVSMTIHLIMEILRGLGYAHNLPLNDLEIRGLVHRDVSPHNVLLSWDGAVKVSDFGIAKAHASSSASASVVVKGKPAYMSPEQANGQALDGRSDLFAVGVMLWEMLTGQSLFHGATVSETLAALFLLPIRSPREVRPEVPSDVAAVAMKLLQRDLSLRYPNAERAVEDLHACRDAPLDGRTQLSDLLRQRFTGQAPRRSVNRASGLAPTQPAPGLLPSPPRHAPSWAARWWLAIVAAAIVVVTVVGLIAFSLSATKPSPAAPAAVIPAAPTPTVNQASATTTTETDPSRPSTAPNPVPAPAPGSHAADASRPAQVERAGRRTAAPAPAPAKTGIRAVRVDGGDP